MFWLVRIQRRVLGNWLNLLSLRFQGKTVCQHKCEELKNKKKDCKVKESVDTNTCGLNTDLQQTNTAVELDCAFGGHMTSSGGYINRSDKSLRCVKCRIVRCSISWAGTHFDWPCPQVHRSGRVCLGSGDGRARTSDMDSGKLTFISRVLRPALLEPQGTGPLSSKRPRRA